MQKANGGMTMRLVNFRVVIKVKRFPNRLKRCTCANERGNGTGGKRTLKVEKMQKKKWLNRVETIWMCRSKWTIEIER